MGAFSDSAKTLREGFHIAKFKYIIVDRAKTRAIFTTHFMQLHQHGVFRQGDQGVAVVKHKGESF